MIIRTDKGDRIHTDEAPHWNGLNMRWYGFRWINARQEWSATSRIHSFKSFEVEPEAPGKT
jgi:hypothetical protein